MAFTPEQHAHVYDFVFSNKTNCDAICLRARGELTSRGLRVWQQKTDIPKDSDKCAPPRLTIRIDYQD